MKVEDFFDEVYYGYLSDIDIYNTVEKLTDGYDQTKLNLLCRDFDFYCFMKQEEYLGSFSNEEIEKKMHEIEKAGKKLPMASDRSRSPLSVSAYFKTPEHKKIKKEADWTDEDLKRWGELFSDIEKNMQKTLDVEKLMDPHGVEFFSLHRLKSLLVDLKRKHTDAIYRFDVNEPQINNIQPINWLKGEGSLIQLMDSLKSAGLIENRDTEEIIQEHFRQTDKKPQPVQWCKSNRLLIYLFNKLSEAGLVDTMDRQFQLITEHFKNKKGQSLKADNLKSDSYNMKNFYTSDPKGSETIDRIIQELTD